MARASRIVNSVSGLRFLTFENLLNHDQTSYAQWKRGNAELAVLLEPPTDTSPAERTALQNIAELSAEIAPLFNRLVATYSAPTPLSPLQQQLQERLASQILIKQQTQINDMLQFASATQDSVARINTQAGLLVGVTVIFMVAVTIANYILFTRMVANSLRELQTGAREIAAHHFEYRIKPHNPHDEFGQVAKVFNNMAEATGRLDQAKSEFVVLAAHQMKTPLGQLRGYIDNLASGAAGKQDAKEIPYLHEMLAVCDRAFHLIDNLLDISQIERGTVVMQRSSHSLRSLVDEAAHVFGQDLTRKNLALTVDDAGGGITVFADPILTVEMLKNILHNAVKYTDKGGVTITLRQEGTWGIVTIADTGSGISEAAHKELFRSSGILGRPLMSGQGAGLGLYVANRFAMFEGGRIKLLPSETGATFEVRLPLAAVTSE